MSVKHVSNSECIHISLESCQHSLPQDLLDFYLLRCPYAQSDQSASTAARGINLADFGWEKSKLSHLMDWIQEAFTDQQGECQIAFLASDSIKQTINDAQLNLSEPCFVHKRAVLQIKSKASIEEDGVCHVKLQETYATCFFRHIRNAIAHGNFYVTDEGRVFLLDSSSKPNTEAEKKKYTPGIMTTLPFLQELKCVVEGGPSRLADQSDGNNKAKKGLYRINLRKEVLIQDKDATSS